MTTTARRRGSGRRPRSGRGRAVRTGSERPPRRTTQRLPTRRRAWTRRWVALLTLLTVLGGIYLLFFSSLLGVRSVEVTGTKGLTTEQVRQEAGVPMGRAMLRLDTDELATRVRDGLPRAASVEVSRSWPSTVRIAVTERRPVAVFRAAQGTRLVDGEGVVFRPAGPVPVRLPELRLARVAPHDPVSTAAIHSLTSLPRHLASQVRSVAAKTPGSVEFRLADGRLVRWGDTSDGARKAAVLEALLGQRGKIYDVSSPDLPTVS
ncbi:MAG: FtsQ-type POTRA domain-containing protein [Pseudonocardiaceae bacterium]|nr:FtsQ-type POTRA domain-containing protein [Pseudonocardiaceae bacterium]